MEFGQGVRFKSAPTSWACHVPIPSIGFTTFEYRSDWPHTSNAIPSHPEQQLLTVFNDSGSTGSRWLHRSDGSKHGSSGTDPLKCSLLDAPKIES
ncbi:hypothetical protein J1614_001873 [Plenodomus biglobosus]|nr:hypothetical protein J1614_001873 [Plenodomus biglobosus]